MLETLIILSFIIGKGLSLALYRCCWEVNRDSFRISIGIFLTSVPVFIALVICMFITWDDLPFTRIFASVVAVQLALAAIGRFDPSRPALIGRGFILLLSSLVYWHPLWLVASLISTCLLQYRQAAWGLSPGYSNLLGFEFSRSSACSIVAALGVSKIGSLIDNSIPQDSIILSVLLLHQASYYINHALAKNAIGSHWSEWMQQNRIQYLVANAWLRGWTLGQSKAQRLRLYQWVAKYRVYICWIAWSGEIAWLFIFLHPTAPLLLYSSALIFHLAVFLLTGLSCWHYLINHLCLIVLFSCFIAPVSSLSMLILSILGCCVVAAWIGQIRIKVFNAYQSEKSSGWQTFADATDHLMAWWDSPLMRMYSFTLETTSGRQFFLPVTKLSPHDTVITDFHTHLMILNLHKELDPKLAFDKDQARTGVWGLLAERTEKEKLYSLSISDIKDKNDTSKPWIIYPECKHAASPLLQHFQAINQCVGNRMFRWIFKWPHFPGEDHAPDLCPLAEKKLPNFPMDETIVKVQLWRVKTWTSPEGFTLLDHSLCGDIYLSNQNEQDRTSE